MRRNAKVDRSQPKLIKECRQIGASVVPLHMVGNGVGDWLLGIHGFNLLCECKEPARRIKLTQAQIKFRDTWNGHYAIVQTFDDILEEIGRQHRKLGCL